MSKTKTKKNKKHKTSEKSRVCKVSLTDGVEVQQVGRPHIPGIFHTTTLTPSQNTRDVKNMFLRQVFVVLNLLCFLVAITVNIQRMF